jgi:hypothetical protein
MREPISELDQCFRLTQSGLKIPSADIEQAIMGLILEAH